MKITVLRTGGFAGVYEELGPVDTDELDAEVGKSVEAKADEVGFFDLPEKLPVDREIRDGYNYRMTIESGAETHTVSYADGTESRYLEPLGDLVGVLRDSGSDYEPKERPND